MEELVGMWQLVNELSEQLQANRALTTALQNQAKDVKGQAMHSGTGFPLRRFNIDITDEQFTSELEKFASHLVLENQMLQHENKQLNVLLKEYEQTLEGVMAKFRGVSYASQQHELTLHQYYTSLLHEIETTHSTSTLLDSTTLSVLLTRLSTLIRAALQSVNGELPSLPTTLPSKSSHGLPPDLTQLLSGSPISSSPSNTLFLTANQLPLPRGSQNGNGSGMGTTSASVLKPKRPSQWLGDLASSGGYPGTEGRGDWALEREQEIVRLEDENKMLREMLGISMDMEPPAPPAGEASILAASVSGSSGEGSGLEVRRGSRAEEVLGAGVPMDRIIRDAPVVVVGTGPITITSPPTASTPSAPDGLETISLSPPPTPPATLPDDTQDTGITPLAPEELEKWLKEEGEAVDSDSPIEEPPSPSHHVAPSSPRPASSSPSATTSTSPIATLRSRSPIATKSTPPTPLSPTLTKGTSPLPALTPPSSGGLSTSPGTPLTALFMKAGGKTKTEPTTGMTLGDVDLMGKGVEKEKEKEREKERTGEAEAGAGTGTGITEVPVAAEVVPEREGGSQTSS